MLRVSTLIILFGLLCCVCGLGRLQKVKVRGRVFCPKNPKDAANLKVKLIDEDNGPDPDDHMGETRTDNDGNFQLEGEEREISNIEARVKIYHDCNDHGRPCQRKWKIGVPSNYVNVNKVFDMGNINLEIIMDEEERDCIH